jgi:hypothetical protein
MTTLLVLFMAQALASEPAPATQTSLSLVSATRSGKTRGWASVGYFGQAGEEWAPPVCDADWAWPEVQQIAGRPALTISAPKGLPLPATVRCQVGDEVYDWTLVAQQRAQAAGA